MAAAAVTGILIAACGGGSTALTGDADTEPSAAPASDRPSDPTSDTTLDTTSDTMSDTTSDTTSEGAARIVQELPQDATTDGSAPDTEEGDGPYVAEDSIDSEDKRISVTLDGKTTYVKNGGRIILGDGRVVEVFVDPYPPSTLRAWLDLYLTQDGEPIEDASIRIEYDMLAMVHGPFTAVAENVGGGHYLFTLDYIMFGPWDQALTISLGLDRIKFPLVLVAYP